ncbi:hypothetical protein F2Q69_00016613 [Brassica cretica]|uniref:Uncharacterized protein n=1 Tax=Brassica cretica TaxID=69181 RepID=A0A8S9QQP3_BRACR|nr:hypothetical protein F2Q69_00016613 [Brassica cretica]
MVKCVELVVDRKSRRDFKKPTAISVLRRKKDLFAGMEDTVLDLPIQRPLNRLRGTVDLAMKSSIALHPCPINTTLPAQSK